MNMSKVKLSDSDWSVLFPQQTYKLGGTSLSLTPLSLTGLANIMAQVNVIVTKMEKLGVALGELVATPQNVTLLVTTIVQDAPSILSELSGLDEGDVAKLPISVAVDLFSVCLDVNLSSQEGLVKNFKRLGEKVAQMTAMPLQ
jgi:hypothetical protein